ncbi:carboxypeptidase-like regulatory domain-containing protein [Gemmatimonadota bacterium Y43]|uniref:TonB-dependent receptor n=1 Tax=Gaopeijia maritima TaxID=3119007 RepID=UPI003278EF0F
MTSRRAVRRTLPSRAALVAACLAGASTGPLAGQRADAVPPSPGAVTGQVLRSDGAPLSQAWIRYRSTSGPEGHAQAGDDGRYRIPAEPGPLTLHIDYIGHRPTSVEVIVPTGTTVRLDIRLEARPLPLEGIVVRADPFRVPAPPPHELRDAVTRTDPEIELAALTLDGGLAEVASAVASARDPSGEPPGDGAQVLLMRGSTADLKLLLLDGAPVYTPFHLAGLLDSFDAEVLGGANHYVGAAPSRYDGGIDYILDLGTRDPRDDERLHLRGHLDLLSAGGAAEWGTEAGGLLVSGRSLHGGGPRILEGIDAPYGYADGLARGALRLGGLRLAVTGFANAESVALGGADNPALPEQAMWSNRVVSLRANHASAGVEWAWGLAASRYDAELPLRGDSTEAASTNPVLAEGTTGRVRATLDGVTTVGEGSVRFGLSADRTRAAYGSSLRSSDGYTRTDARSSGHSLGAHGEWSTPLSTSVRSRVGLRVDRFSPGGLRGALRGSLAWVVTPNAVLTLAGGRYHQFTRASDAVVEGNLTSLDADDPLDPDLTALQVARGDHVLMGLDQQLTPLVGLGLQGWVKHFANLEASSESRRSSGVDLRLRAGDDRRTGWVGYSLSWTWAEGGSGVAGSTDRFLGRHLLTAGYRGALAGAWGVDARVSFSDGLPLTEVPLEFDSPAGPRDDVLGSEGVRDPSLPTDADGFLRLDLEVFGEWDAPVGEGRVRPYLKVMNALDRRDALFYYFEPWRGTDVTPLARRSILPVVGVAWRF